MTDLEKYIALVNCKFEYMQKMPHDVKGIELVKTGRDGYPEVIEIHWKSGGKSGIGNKRVVDLVKPYINDVTTFCDMVKGLIEEDRKAAEPAAKEEAFRTRPWTYILGVLDDNGKRVDRYSWYEDNSWDLYGMTDSEVLKNRIEDCRRWRVESTSRWHVYKRMRGSDKLEVVF